MDSPTQSLKQTLARIKALFQWTRIMKLKLFRHKEKKWSSVFRAFLCLVTTILAGCSSTPEPMTLAPELCSIESGAGENYSQTINFEQYSTRDVAQSNNSQMFYHAIAKPITTEYTYPVEVQRISRLWGNASLSETEIVDVNIDASNVWGAAASYNIDDAIESAIENCERAGANVRYAHSEFRSSGYILPPSELTECKLTEVSACAATETEVNEWMLSAEDQDLADQYIPITSDEMDQVTSDAALSYTRTDIIESPEKYIEIELYRDDLGRILASFKNASGLPIKNIQVQFLTSFEGLGAGFNDGRFFVMGEIEELDIDNTVIVNVSNLEFPLPFVCGPRFDDLQIELLSVELE